MSAQSALVPAGSRALGLGFSGNLGNIDAYISAVNRLPMLSHEEEVSLAKSLQEKNDLDAAQKLVMSHLRLVVTGARDHAEDHQDGGEGAGGDLDCSFAEGRELSGLAAQNPI